MSTSKPVRESKRRERNDDRDERTVYDEWKRRQRRLQNPENRTVAEVWKGMESGKPSFPLDHRVRVEQIRDIENVERQAQNTARKLHPLSPLIDEMKLLQENQARALEGVVLMTQWHPDRVNDDVVTMLEKLRQASRDLAYDINDFYYCILDGRAWQSGAWATEGV